MAPLPRMLLLAGIGLIVIAVLWHFGSRMFPLGRLPGDITVERGRFRFYFPLATCVVLSVLLSLVLYLFSRFWK